MSILFLKSWEASYNMASSDWNSLTTWLSAVGLYLHIKALSLQYFYFPQCCLMLLQCRLWWIMLSKVLPEVTSVSQQWLIKMIIWNHYKRWWKIWWPDIIVNVVSFSCKMDNCEQCHFEYTSFSLQNYFFPKPRRKGDIIIRKTWSCKLCHLS